MRVVVCAAAVPNPAAVRWDRFRGLVDTQDAEPMLNPPDRVALELAARIVEEPAHAGPVTFEVLSAGPHAAAALREAAAFGAARLIALDDPALNDADEFGTAAALAAGLATLGGADVICCGSATSTYGSGAVGGLIAAALSAEVIADVINAARWESGLQIDYIAHARIKRRVMPGPIVLVAAAYGVVPRTIAPMTALRAGRKPIETLSLADVGVSLPLPASGARDGPTSATRGKRAGETITGDTATARALTVVGALRERHAI